ncbi:MAG: tRNA-binding protein [Pseudomonadota bacterium]|nr:tRNA-binding protein [Pseudomonadota bacterium]
MIDFSDFQKVDIRTGTITRAELNPQAHTPAYVMHIDFGEMGEKVSSAQITENYGPEDLVGLQVIAVVNFPPKRIAGVKSEVLVLGAMSDRDGTVLLQTERPTENGISIA